MGAFNRTPQVLGSTFEDSAPAGIVGSLADLARAVRGAQSGRGALVGARQVQFGAGRQMKIVSDLVVHRSSLGLTTVAHPACPSFSRAAYRTYGLQ
jgi:hypothetical protein